MYSTIHRQNPPTSDCTLVTSVPKATVKLRVEMDNICDYNVSLLETKILLSVVD